MGEAARGNALLIGWRPERSHTVPPAIGTGLEWLNPGLPANFPLTRSSEEPGQVNRSGFTEPSIPGYVTGDGTSIVHPFTVPMILPFLQHILGSTVANGTLVKTELEAGAAYRYVFEADPDGLDQTQEWLVAFEPAYKAWERGVKWAQMQMAITTAGGIPTTLTGFSSHRSRLGGSTPEGANTGAYALGPHIRGPLKDRTVGRIWTQITDLGPPMKFKVIAAAALPDAPTWAAATEYTVEFDPQTEEGLWQFGMDADGLDLGHYDSEVADPFQIIWPGAHADRSTAAVGDTWSFEVEHTLPVPTYSSSLGKRLGVGHWKSEARDLGAGAWAELALQQMTHILNWPITPDQGGSIYYTGLDRDGLLAPTFACQRKLIDDWIESRVEARERFELRQSLIGRQLGTGAYRESVVIEAPNVGISEHSKDTGQTGVIPESFTLTAETDGSGSAPVTYTLITDRDWTPAT